MQTTFARFAALRGETAFRGVTSVCSAHPWVIEAALEQAKADGGTALIEATCNQVNQEGGYTGLRPADFRDLVWSLADRVGLARDRVVLGGDHLGPNPWKSLPAEAAMDRALAMVESYARAGFTKLHLDCSMGCAGEPAALGDSVVAGRAARLAARAEAVAPGATVYVIGTEVPTPGGATEGLDHLVPTAPEAVLETHAVHERAFREAAPSAWERVIAMVVQPGVEFGHEDVAIFRPEAAAALSATLRRLPGLVFEAHSTDYQPGQALRELVRSGYPILKVGPGLSFALRETLYGLDAIAAILSPGGDRLFDAMEGLMLARPQQWRSHYAGTPDEQRVLRHFSYSDRIRYYWPEPEAVAAVAALEQKLAGRTIPPTLLSQYLPRLAERVADGLVDATPKSLAIEAVRDVLRVYAGACNGAI
ncbi:D-tagatose-bisphosphate aldolase, class II, non-catalytic subunit [Acetobacteraceae bacterium KSS8]|uniref:D-tagatose-bisphosphate aldolase, class II, non-catalytic subunit n=1 Tax=Endosaccharibacter trunci TaxID=2812733 RepID=A0ABT1W5S3_9PROT|nr:D-tagatose-bisphosphate aldolase, class II, non-catalytic subunit [Acetobacteraceae bacterium KSS8]